MPMWPESLARVNSTCIADLQFRVSQDSQICRTEDDPSDKFVG
ncbi:MAG: hypothetical protein JWO19_4610 [Bryobacterales bacterium]|nr:hypothetical protein [Bryobacterales bacterium]